MRTQKLWIACLILFAGLIADGVTSASPAYQEQERPPLSEEERKKVLERLTKAMQEAQKTQNPASVPPAQQPAAAPAPAAPAPAPPPIPSVVRRAPLAGGQVQLSYDNADLYDFINQIANALGITPIVIDPEVKGTVTIQSSAPMSKEDVFPLFNLILKNNNAALVKQGDIYQIVPISAGLKKGLDVIEHLPPAPAAKPEEKEPEKKPETAPAPAGRTVATPFGPATVPPQAPARTLPAAPAQTAPSTAAAAPRAGEADRTGMLATHVIRVEFVPVKDLVDPVKLFMTDGGVIMPYERLNMLIVTDYSDSVNKILELSHMLDDNYLNPDLIELIKIKYNASTDVLEDLKKIFGSGGKDSPTGINFISLDRLNAILVMANSSRALGEVKRWIKELDATTGRSIQTFVYTVENSTASNIALIISALFGGGEGGGGTGGTGPTTGPFGVGRAQSGTMGGAGGTSTYGSTFGGGSTFGSSGFGAYQSGGSGPYQGGIATPFGGTGGYQGGYGGGTYGGGTYGGGTYGGGMYGGGLYGGGQQLGPRLNQQATVTSQVIRGGGFTGLQSDVRLVVDDINNSLIIQASPADYAYMVETIKKLDVLPRQAIIDARIFEVDLTDAFTFGVSANLQGLTSGQHLTTAALDSTTGALTANTFAFVGNSREILLAIDTLRQKTKVRVLEAPSVLALDGTVAHIVVGSEVPYPGTNYITVGGTSSGVSYRDTGISLIVMPRISASGHVTLDIAQEVSSPGAPVPVNGQSAPSFAKTSVQTTLSVKDGETVAIAGLIRDSNNVARNGVPYLSDIPLIGALFGRTNRSVNRTELLILITPHVIRTAERFQEMTQELKDSLRNVRKLVDKKDQEHKDDMEDARQERYRQEEKRLRLKDQEAPKPESPKAAPPQPAEEPPKSPAPPPGGSNPR